MLIITLIACTAMLASCGAPTTQEANALPDDELGAYGAVVAVGENWQLLGDPASNALSVYMDDGTEASGTWVRPYYVQGRISASDIQVILENVRCEQDNIPYPMSATVTFPGHTLRGCAAMRWDSELSTLIEEIDVCIAAKPSLRTITYAGELPDGSVLVRVRDGDDMQDCRVEGGRATQAPRGESLAVATDNTAVLLRARPGETENPGGECYEAPEASVHGQYTSEMVGWMLDPLGC
ncbi:MAG: hypothetical protein H7124_06850 [Phycisphaerales bacterium]|nr:hypothetical protein [Hyphomonadaceae bacterium]